MWKKQASYPPEPQILYHHHICSKEKDPSTHEVTYKIVVDIQKDQWVAQILAFPIDNNRQIFSKLHGAEL